MIQFPKIKYFSIELLIDNLLNALQLMLNKKFNIRAIINLEEFNNDDETHVNLY